MSEEKKIDFRKIVRDILVPPISIALAAGSALGLAKLVTSIRIEQPVKPNSQIERVLENYNPNGAEILGKEKIGNLSENYKP